MPLWERVKKNNKQRVTMILLSNAPVNSSETEAGKYYARTARTAQRRTTRLMIMVIYVMRERWESKDVKARFGKSG